MPCVRVMLRVCVMSGQLFQSICTFELPVIMELWEQWKQKSYLQCWIIQLKQALSFCKLIFMLHRNEKQKVLMENMQYIICSEYDKYAHYSVCVLCIALAVPWYFLQCRSRPLEGSSAQGCQGFYDHLFHLGDQWTLAAVGFDPHSSSSDLRLLSGFKPARVGVLGGGG